MKSRFYISCLLSLSFLITFCSFDKHRTPLSERITTHHFLNDFPAIINDSLVNIVIEIPAGCNQKWEVNKQNGFLEWQRIGKDSLRMVQYLPYPANYGMIPGTLLPASEGGDNDPLDVFLLGVSQERGSVVQGRVVGVIRMLDQGMFDDKLIAVPVNDWHYPVNTLAHLDSLYPGISQILVTWLANYKGPGVVQITGIEDEVAAWAILQKSL
jgi:inorganic pyrophosphatase